VQLLASNVIAKTAAVLCVGS